jgi:hypothetical protein
LRSDGQHKKTEAGTAKPSALGSQRLCLVPHTRRFLGRQPLGVEPAVKVMLVSGYFTFPSLRSRSAKKRDGQSDRERLPIARRLFCGSPCPHLGTTHRVRTWGKGGPRHLRSRPSFYPTGQFEGRAATTLSNAGGSETAARRCGDESLRRISTAPRLSKTNAPCPSAKNCDVRFEALSGFPQGSSDTAKPPAR